MISDFTGSMVLTLTKLSSNKLISILKAFNSIYEDLNVYKKGTIYLKVIGVD